MTESLRKRLLDLRLEDLVEVRLGDRADQLVGNIPSRPTMKVSGTP